jgi:hypothetical protein
VRQNKGHWSSYRAGGTLARSSRDQEYDSRRQQGRLDKEAMLKAKVEAGVSVCLLTVDLPGWHIQRKTTVCGKPPHTIIADTLDQTKATCEDCLVMLDWGLENGTLEIVDGYVVDTQLAEIKKAEQRAWLKEREEHQQPSEGDDDYGP